MIYSAGQRFRLSNGSLKKCFILCFYALQRLRHKVFSDPVTALSSGRSISSAFGDTGSSPLPLKHVSRPEARQPHRRLCKSPESFFSVVRIQVTVVLCCNVALLTRIILNRNFKKNTLRTRTSRVLNATISCKCLKCLTRL